MASPSNPILERLMLNAIKDPGELAEFAASHENPEVCKEALDKLMKLDLLEERKAALICSVVKKTSHEPVARHALGYCAVSTLPDEVKAFMIKKALDEIKFESVRKEMEQWLKEHGH